MRSDYELEPVVRALSLDGDVGAVLTEHEVTAGEFLHLDEHPGVWGYEFEGRNWHHRLRAWRNSRAVQSHRFAH